MKEVEGVGKTKEEALHSALSLLGVGSLDELSSKFDIDVIEEHPKGLFKMFSSHMKVKLFLTEKTSLLESVIKNDKSELDNERAFVDSDFNPEEFLDKLLNLIGVDASIEVFNREDDELFFKIHSSERGIIIGKHGETLDAIQYILNIVSSRKGYDYNIYIDLDGYREKRKIYLKQVARRAVSKVRRTGETVELDPMNTVERRYIHKLLKKNAGIITKSEGKEPKRRVIVYPESNGGRRPEV